MVRTGICCLGRHGDVINALPIALHAYQNGYQPTIIVSEPWSGILDGVSYCDKLVWNGPYSQPMEAKKWAESLHRFDQIWTAQCYGQAHSFECDNFCEEAWRIVGLRDMFGKVPLVFDRRDRVREAELIPDSKLPIVLVNGEGISSAFPNKERLYELIQPLTSDYYVVDMSRLHAERFYDLLGIFGKAVCLVTVDSGPLHLAQAVPTLPVIALITDQISRWHGSPARPNHVLRIRYSEFNDRNGEIVPMIRNLPHLPARKLVHVWSEYDRSDTGAIQRHMVAKMTWELEFGKDTWIDRPVFDTEFSRNGGSELGEKKSVPFVGDLIQKGADEAGPQDIIVLTNDDTCVRPGLTRILLDEVPKCGAVFGPRRELAKLTHALTLAEMLKGYKHVGADVFAFTRAWWDENKVEFPDMLIGFEQWDLVLKKLILATGGRELDDLCYHQIHTPDWVKQRQAAGGKFNRTQAYNWYKQHGLPWT